jgi:hypothetical protein
VDQYPKAEEFAVATGVTLFGPALLLFSLTVLLVLSAIALKEVVSMSVLRTITIILIFFSSALGEEFGIAADVTFFGPVSLLFFFTVLFIVSAVKMNKIPPLHPMHYFFLAAAFFAFHLLFTSLIYYVNIHAALLVSALISCALVFAYVTMARGARYAVAYATLPQLMFLVLFAYAFVYRDHTRLIISSGVVASLAVLMFATGRVDWAAKFGLNKAKNQGPTFGAGP